MRVLMTALALLAVAFAGCTDSGGEGSASIYVKDAPTDEFAEIHVVFTQVEVHFAGNGSDAEDSGDNETEDGDHEDDGTSSWKTLFENEEGADVDLRAANGTAAAFLGEADLAVGKYTQIRIHVSEAYGIDHDGERHEFSVPSSTLKIVRPFDVHADEETQIVVDYDLDRSLTKAGPTGWKLTPVIGKTHVNHVEDDESGEDVHSEGEIDDDVVDE